MSFYSTIYNIFMKRNSIFVSTIFFGAFLFQPGFESGINKWWDYHNKGKLWKDIKGKIGESGEEEEEDDE
ncbi:CYFA0S05e03312g1_1 [Cyberlindnera fabianii]|uniref:Complex III subunit 9 n=1 Tax=Cyberlindnera fabianii TaxID=36022 RepID=A0A061AZ64_CYBFA|nr:CYFA0S05e03312g1_1 [Cyberlindnera fabianii]